MSTVHIERIAAGGDGVGRLASGLTVFVPRTAPGDMARIEVRQRKRRYARGRLHALEHASRDRVDAPCRHYRDDDCGGCQLQHLAPPAQRMAKSRMVGDALRRIGHREVSDPPIHPSPAQWRYRTKITLAVRGSTIGLHPYGESDRVFELDDCPIASERVMHLWARVRADRRLLPHELESLVLREDRSGGLHLVAVGGDVAWDAEPLAAAIADPEVAYWWAPRRGAARVVAGGPPGFPACAFDQVNLAFARSIQTAAVDALGPVSGRVVWDLYGGVGDTADLLASRGARVWTVDADRRAVSWARDRDRGQTGPRPTRLAARVEESLHRLPDPDAMVVNPPRAGLHSRVVQWLQQWAHGRAGRLAYVSCDPATLARDLSRLPALHIRSIAAYDLFPQTSHVETLAVLEAP